MDSIYDDWGSKGWPQVEEIQKLKELERPVKEAMQKIADEVMWKTCMDLDKELTKGMADGVATLTDEQQSYPIEVYRWILKAQGMPLCSATKESVRLDLKSQLLPGFYYESSVCPLSEDTVFTWRKQQ